MKAGYKVKKAIVFLRQLHFIHVCNYHEENIVAHYVSDLRQKKYRSSIGVWRPKESPNNKQNEEMPPHIR